MTRGWRAALITVVVIGLACGLPAALQAQTDRVVRSAISGQVLPLRLATSGQAVKQGDPLVFVRTTTGSAVPAAVAPVDGRVTQVLVSAGDFVNIGDPVATITPK